MKIFVKYQAQGRGFNPNSSPLRTPLYYVLRSHMTQLDTRRWWWHVTSWVKHEALLQVKNT